ncbi:MAG: biotin transporter BioY [Clostridiales bacterium]|nr:biotin transporter BioY [Clostridiales bacterium]
MKSMKVKDMTLTAVMAALICIAGPLTIAAGPVPLSLATFAIYLAGAILGKKWGTVSVGLYLLIGIIGVPVFSGFSGGFQKLAGVTGGYLIGYLPCAFLTGLGAEKAERAGKKRILPLMMVAGTIVLYTVGTAWFMIQTGNGIGAALGLCVLPFLPGDAMKIAAATLLAVPVKNAVKRTMNN